MTRNYVGLAVAILIVSIAPSAIAKPNVGFPETTLCPKEDGDLDYAIYSIMRAADFEEDPDGGVRFFRRDATTAKDLLQFDLPRWLRASFITFDTSGGTKLIAELHYVTPTKVREVEDPKITSLFQDVLDKMSVQFPCA